MSQLTSELSKVAAQTERVESLLRKALPQTSKIINSPELNFDHSAKSLLGRIINRLDLFEELRNDAENVLEIINSKS